MDLALRDDVEGSRVCPYNCTILPVSPGVSFTWVGKEKEGRKSGDVDRHLNRDRKKWCALFEVSSLIAADQMRYSVLRTKPRWEEHDDGV